jgi:diacylglycerol kinase family enzyme
LTDRAARFFAIVNPAAGGGRCGKLAPAALDRVRKALGGDSSALEIVHTSRAGEGTELARAAYREGFRRFLGVGGDGTSYEIVNGVLPESLIQSSAGGRISLAFLPLGTGNSFLRDFTSEGVENTMRALAAQRSRACDAIRVRYSTGELYFINLMCLGFPADVAELTNRRFKPVGELGYVFAVFGRLANLKFESLPHRVAALGGSAEWDRRPCLFLTFANSKFTGGKMMIAPKADSGDGLIEYVRWSPLSRPRLLANFPRLFTGSHITDPRASRASTKRVDFALDGPVNVVVDGETLRLNLESLEILPAALDVIV